MGAHGGPWGPMGPMGTHGDPWGPCHGAHAMGPMGTHGAGAHGTHGARKHPIHPRNILVLIKNHPGTRMLTKWNILVCLTTLHGGGDICQPYGKHSAYIWSAPDRMSILALGSAAVGVPELRNIGSEGDSYFGIHCRSTF